MLIVQQIIKKVEKVKKSKKFLMFKIAVRKQ